MEDKKKNSLWEKIAREENVPLETLQERIKKWTVVIPFNKKRKISHPCAIGEGMRVKVNVNLGSSWEADGIKEELQKLSVAIKYGADTVMDLSTGRRLKEIRKAILENSPVPVGTVPIYEVAVKALQEKGNLSALTPRDILNTIEEQAKEGVDFFTIHCGLNKKTLEVFSRQKRLMDIVSRGGAILLNWMLTKNKENPMYEYFDEILNIAKDYNITLSLGDSLRPGSVLDATDPAQIEELIILGELTRRAHQKGVAVIIEGPGHMTLDQIEANVLAEKKLCQGAPFYVLGPLVTDIALGYDHIAGAIGAAYAAYYGADFLCYVTPAEHLGLPTVEDVKEGTIAFKIAAHAGDLARGKEKAYLRDKQISQARKKRKWDEQFKLSFDPEKARAYYFRNKPKAEDVCSMCSKLCSIKLVDKCLEFLIK
ncbi:MAG: phosphomethylpyrimidine synthase ThiC [Candidatus Omnitrophica bacterium]|nr:phosphomethylpyrimidine synthase ThiC [Candidatus Omnitrophota bacterium]